MKKKYYTCLILEILLVVSIIMLLLKYNELKIDFIDGDGIGIYFLGFEINDRVSSGEISVYRNIFFNTSIMFSIIAFINGFLLINIKRKYKALNNKE
ncbi:hypothetical protein [Clostridium grantii]|uniref:Uncharacterized protein n=1 Tax=Clostridium grantii DSM 8605 TaxID=1121316 RepID=A0A1M5V5L9_9CLOT|nr:hypothetical protein [Clostridium grantii]SHH70547.1 hypothetical protein SAMN02745207_02101 [Clostridium grantii DSM 8605]